MGQSSLSIISLRRERGIVTALANLLVKVVANGGSVSFMHPMAMEDAISFWENALSSADSNERIVLGAFENDHLVATVSLLLQCPPNQPHRAEIAKLMTDPAHRGKGIGKELVKEAERLAIENGRTLLNLDTAAEDGASFLYDALGFIRGGVIPNFAYKPHGGLTDTIIYWKWLGSEDDAPVVKT